MTRSILDALSPRQPRVDVRFHGGGAGLRGPSGGRTPRRPEDLVLNPELVGNRGVELLRVPVPVHRVEDPAAVVDHRLEDLLERGVIRARRVVRERESDDREHLTGRRNGPLNERSARLLKCTEQLRRERQRSAGAGGDSKKFATVDHDGFAACYGLHASRVSGSACSGMRWTGCPAPATAPVTSPAASTWNSRTGPLRVLEARLRPGDERYLRIGARPGGTASSRRAGRSDVNYRRASSIDRRSARGRPPTPPQ